MEHWAHRAGFPGEPAAPGLDGLFDHGRGHLFDAIAGRLECRTGVPDALADRRRSRAAGRMRDQSDANRILERGAGEWRRSRNGVARMWPGQDFEAEAEIRNASCHWSLHLHQLRDQRTARRFDARGVRNAATRRLQRHDAAAERRVAQLFRRCCCRGRSDSCPWPARQLLPRSSHRRCGRDSTDCE